MLALNQVLRKHWSCLTTFGTSTGWSKMERLGGAEITGSHSFFVLVDPVKGFRVYAMGMGCQPMASTMINLFCNV
jgi:hypothetical protein